MSNLDIRKETNRNVAIVVSKPPNYIIPYTKVELGSIIGDTSLGDWFYSLGDTRLSWVPMTSDTVERLEVHHKFDVANDKSSCTLKIFPIHGECTTFYVFHEENVVFSGGLEYSKLSPYHSIFNIPVIKDAGDVKGTGNYSLRTELSDALGELSK